ncbi:IS66 family insertion sequence element accessory protein TnpB [Alicyclobacillus tolerans]|uniref:IS66 family insertion sequence element accessory protein TnpB n=1 Tax=Alicyclobacillus tolerans TaxID=90970 RepID=UPI003B7D1ABD
MWCAPWHRYAEHRCWTRGATRSPSLRRHGHAQIYRRLERGRFWWPDTSDGKTLVITRREMNWLLDGLPLKQPKAHRRVTAKKVV